MKELPTDAQMIKIAQNDTAVNGYIFCAPIDFGAMKAVFLEKTDDEIIKGIQPFRTLDEILTK